MERTTPLRLVRAPRDTQVGRAIQLMQNELTKRWTVNELARRVGLSRAAFARRFVAETGDTPARFLARQRLMRARELLHESDAGLAQIAAQVGYDSEFAFNRAFKRLMHIAPGTFRKLAQRRVTFRAAA